MGAEQRGSASFDINSPVMGIQMGRKSREKYWISCSIVRNNGFLSEHCSRQGRPPRLHLGLPAPEAQENGCQSTLSEDN